ncbi:MAG: class I SAM-dependent methyltransferase [Gammaproteobacteria bacterium]|nr:class I SAM-dependent methyltransferase [Gammaproteobacteria bacterium]
MLNSELPDSVLSLHNQILYWFDQPLGRSLQALEARHIRQALPRLYGTVALQVGRVGRLDLMTTAVPPTRILLDRDIGRSRCSVKGTPDSLPFESKSVDLVILPHTLDFTEQPRQVLREVHRVLSPEGHVIILGFNPMSAWGLWRLIARYRSAMPWRGNFLKLSRIKDWLDLLDFELAQGRMLYYRPPLQKSRFRDRLAFLEKIGDRWWPMGAAVYMVVAKKRVLGMTPLQPSWYGRKAVVSGMAEPAAKVIYPRIPHWLRRDRSG